MILLKLEDTLENFRNQIENFIEQKMMDISIPYYEDMSRISNSNIGWFLKKGPAYLHAMLTGTAQGETGPQLQLGTMIHEYLLQPLEFQKDYVVWDKSRPSSAQQEKFCEELANSTEIEPNKAVLSAYKASYRTTGKSEDKCLSEGLKIAEELKDYIQSKKENDSRIKINHFDVNRLMTIAENIHNHKLADKLVKNEYIGTEDELHHEFHINWEMNGVKCKSLLDSVHFDFKNRICTLVDLKTTSHIGTFEDSMRDFDYLRQLMYYTLAIKWYLKNERGENVDDWSFEWFIVAIDTTGTNEIRVFQFDKEQVESRYDTICDSLEKINWHQTNNKWEHHKEYYDGNGAEKLSL